MTGWPSGQCAGLRVGQRVLANGKGSGVIEEVRDRDVLINFGPRSAEHTDGSRCSTCSCERREWAYKQHVSLTVGERERLERRPA